MNEKTETRQHHLPKNWDEDTRNEIAKLRKEGVSIPAIAAVCHKSTRDVSVFLREQGICTGHRCDAWTPEEDEIVREHLDKKYTWLMARLPGRTYSAIKNRRTIIRKLLSKSSS